jgi:Ca2+:H+ antiporter
MPTPTASVPRTAWLLPIAAILFFGVISALGSGPGFEPTPLGIALAVLLIPILFGTVFAAVHHAEVLAHRFGEPYGTLILTAAVTVIEVALIVSVMLGGEGGTLARDTVFAVLPSYTHSALGPVYAPSQLAFVSLATLALYGGFLYIQTVRHRDYFTVFASDEEPDDHRQTNRLVVLSTLLLVVALLAVILLAKKFAAVVQVGLAQIGAPEAATGVILALLILMPEGVAALQAARRDELQKSLNLALGSSLATIGLTIPAVAAVALALDKDLVLGLAEKDAVVLVLTLFVSVLTFGTGRTDILYGFVHLVIFATFVLLVLVP